MQSLFLDRKYIIHTVKSQAKGGKSGLPTILFFLKPLSLFQRGNESCIICPLLGPQTQQCHLKAGRETAKRKKSS